MLTIDLPATSEPTAEPETAAGLADEQFSTGDRPASVLPESPISYVTRAALTVLSVLLLAFVIDVGLVASLEERASQHSGFDRLRKELAAGTAPVAPVSSGQQANGPPHLLSLGTPIGLLRIPAIHLQQVIEEGTTGGVLTHGPGHRRDTPFPGQTGTSYVLGREAAYGGPFGHIAKLRPGELIKATTQAGIATFKVIDVRHAGQAEPPRVANGSGRLTLETAEGSSFFPSGVVFVDADLQSKPLGSEGPGLSRGLLPANEKAMASDSSHLFVLVLWLEALLLLAVGLVISWRRFGKVQTWIVFVPLLAVVCNFASQQVMLLLPNLT